MDRYTPPAKYDASETARYRDAVSDALKNTQDRRTSIELADPSLFIFMRSPNGNRWKLSVSNAGALVVTAA